VKKDAKQKGDGNKKGTGTFSIYANIDSFILENSVELISYLYRSEVA